MGFIKQLIQFLKDVAQDPRIPERDKAVLLGLIALLVSPFDFIPDWIPLFGQLDDVVILAVILDYFFNVLDEEILLSHYPWDMKSFVSVRRYSRWMAMLTPAFVKDRIWNYKGSVYHR